MPAHTLAHSIAGHTQMRKRCDVLCEPRPAGARAIELASTLALRHVLHAVILVVVLWSPGIWSSPVYYLAATNGILYVNYVNFQDLLAQPEFAGLRAMFGGAPELSTTWPDPKRSATAADKSA
jgi:uncharacterized membrane protein